MFLNMWFVVYEDSRQIWNIMGKSAANSGNFWHPQPRFRFGVSYPRISTLIIRIWNILNSRTEKWNSRIFMVSIDFDFSFSWALGRNQKRIQKMTHRFLSLLWLVHFWWSLGSFHPNRNSGRLVYKLLPNQPYVLRLKVTNKCGKRVSVLVILLKLIFGLIYSARKWHLIARPIRSCFLPFLSGYKIIKL